MLSAFLALTLLLAAAVRAQTSCEGTLSSPNPVTNDVVVPNGASCTLSANVTGSITIGSGASFTTSGIVQVDGSITATSGTGALTFGSSLIVMGGVMVDGATAVSVVSGAQLTLLAVKSVPALTVSGTVGTLSVEGVAQFTLGGTTSSLSVKGDGNVLVDGGKIVAGGGYFRDGGEGSNTFCGAQIVGGGVQLKSVTGDLAIVASASCAPSAIEGAIQLSGGTGNVDVTGATLVSADVLLGDQTGNVALNNLAVSDVSITSQAGSVQISSMADSDTTLSAVTGPISITNFATQGDFAVVEPQDTLTIANSNFGNEVLLIESPAGAVTLTNNTDVGLLISGAPSVTASGNTARSAEFKSNGPVVLNGNSFTMSLVCVENESVTGAGNTFQNPDGQCDASLN